MMAFLTQQRRRRVFFAACLAGLLGLAAVTPAQADDVAPDRRVAYTEYAVKAAFLYNFAKFTQWPQEAYAGAVINICVLGHDPFGPALDGIAGKRIQGREVAIRRIADIDDALACQVLFISRSEGVRLVRVLAGLQGRPILTVTDSGDAVPAVGMIQLRVIADKVRFQIDTEHATGAGLSFSSKLLSLAETHARSLMPQLSGAGPQG